MGRQRNVFKRGQDLASRHRLDREDIDAGMTDMARAHTSIIASSSTSAPRAVFTKMTPGFIAAMRSRERKPLVSSVSSRCSETTSLFGEHLVER